MDQKIPEMQWAQVFEKSNGPIEYKQVPVPTPGPDEVLVNIKFTGVCHTDLHVRCDFPIADLTATLTHLFRLGKATGLLM